ncbi:MAG TPA: hypothetical protein VHN20_04730 [Beijerinckiaceae bacterium]|nr:hypothetical protein [Beijerinckiaceae bacterium]
MAQASIRDRRSIERLYPREDFEREAGQNADAKATVHRGIRILSPVDAQGQFEAERASRHVGEADPLGDTVFLAPFLQDASAAPAPSDSAYGGPGAGDAMGASARKRDDYDAFIARIVGAAQSAEFKPAIGRDDERLRGFHGG